METRETNVITTGNENSMELSNSVQCDSFENANENSADEGTTEATVTVETADEGSPAAHNMLVGALWCIGGIIFTAVSYSAVKETGGTYFIAWGAVVFGGYQFLKGVFQAIL